MSVVLTAALISAALGALGAFLGCLALAAARGSPLRVLAAVTVAVLCIGAPAAALAQAESGSVLDAVGATWPQVAPWLALVPVFQVVAVALAKIPTMAGVKHETMWSRFWRNAAALPVLLAKR